MGKLVEEVHGVVWIVVQEWEAEKLLFVAPSRNH